VLYSVYQADTQRVASGTLSQVLLLAGSQVSRMFDLSTAQIVRTDYRRSNLLDASIS
jgi:hypothetical protein